MPTKPSLHLDADISDRDLFRALLDRGHDVTRTPNEWIEEDASDEVQLSEATARGRIILTHNIRDFIILAQLHPDHAGIVVAPQIGWGTSQLIQAVDRMLTETTAEEWVGQVRWLNQWR